MNNKEMLCAAAKASGVEITGWRLDRECLFNAVEVAVCRRNDAGGRGTYLWQPLQANLETDCKHDALRLAEQLNLSTENTGTSTIVRDHTMGCMAQENNANDEDAALCRAVVYTAALVQLAIERKLARRDADLLLEREAAFEAAQLVFA